jgi:predicted exporter
VYLRNRLTKVLTIIGLAAFAAIGAWQFYLFMVFRDANGIVDVQGGIAHFWLAIGITVVTSVAGFFLFSNFLRYDQRNEMHINLQGHPLAVGRTTKELL